MPIFEVQTDGVFNIRDGFIVRGSLGIAPLQGGTGNEKTVSVAFDDDGKGIVLSRGDLVAGEGARPTQSRTYSELIFARNSPLDLVLLSLSISNSMASTGESGLSTLRNTQMRVRSSFGIRSSSFRVPER